MRIPVPGRRVASRVIDGQALLLDPGRDELQRLNEVGSFLWGLIKERRHDVDALRAALAEAFEVEPSAAGIDLQDFLNELEARGLIVYRG
jgi:hypothetical protein